MAGRDYVRTVLTGERRDLSARLLTAVLSPFVLLYGMVVLLRNFCYDRGLLSAQRLNRPVISVGNLTMGGTGKTPMVILLARLLISRGLKVCVLSRGYGGTMGKTGGIIADGSDLLATPSEAGDEPYLMACSVPGLMVAVGADRHAAGLLAQERLAPDIFVLDDGFQHRRLARDLDIVLLDAERPFANGFLLPAGGLREPVSSLKRAHLAIVTRCRSGSDLPPISLPTCRAFHLPGMVTSLTGGPAAPLSSLAGERVAAFAGIASPKGFFDMLRQADIELVDTLALPDHASYGPVDVEAVAELGRRTGATILLTTAKDGVKLVPWADRLGDVRILSLEMGLGEPELLESILSPLLPSNGA